MEKFNILPKNKISQLPESTGVYCFKNSKPLYIGKATNIKKRVKDHFSKAGFRESIFLEKTKKIGYIKTDSEIEALLLESKLIKKYKPKFNIAWKDDKNHFYVVITKESFPRIFLTHQFVKRDKKEIKIIGPFVEGKAVKRVLDLLRKIFPFRSCKKIPKKPCLWYQLERCPAPCLLKSPALQLSTLEKQIRKESKENAKKIAMFFEGKQRKILKNLQKIMEKESRKENFEKAAKIRDQIFALKKILAHTRIISEFQNLFQKFSELKKILKGSKLMISLISKDSTPPVQ